MEQRANSNILLRVPKGGREKAPDWLHTVALLGRKRRKNKQASGRMV